MRGREVDQDCRPFTAGGGVDAGGPAPYELGPGVAVPDVGGAQETERVGLTPGVEPLVDRFGEMVLLFAPLCAGDPDRVGSFGIASAELVAKQLAELGMVRVAPEIPVDAGEKNGLAFQALQEVGGVGASRDLAANRGADVIETCGFHQETLHVIWLFEEHLCRQEVVHISRGFFGRTLCRCLDHQAGCPTIGALDERRRVDLGLLGVLEQASRLLDREPEVARRSRPLSLRPGAGATRCRAGIESRSGDSPRAATRRRVVASRRARRLRSVPARCRA